MKKLLLGLILCSTIFLIACNDNKDLNSNNTNPNQQDEINEIDDNPVIEYDSTDFSKKAGFKVNLDDSLKGVKYDSIFLIAKTVAQLDLKFPDNTIGTLLIDSSEYSKLETTDSVIFIDDIKVSIENGLDGIYSYEWKNGNYTLTYSTSTDLKDSEILTNLVNGVTIEKTK